MKNIFSILPALILGACMGLHAQNYTVSTSTAAYTNLSNPTYITKMFDNVAYTVEIPFKVLAFGTEYDLSKGVLISTDGYIDARNESDSTLIVIMALGAHMIRRNASSSVAYTIEGEPGNRILKIEWKDTKLMGNPARDSANAQLWLYENNNDFEVHIGPVLITDVSAINGAEGPTIGITRTNPDLTVVYNTSFLSGIASEPGVDTAFAFFPLSSIPNAGTVYHFSYAASAGVAPVAATGDGPAIRFEPNPCREATRLVIPDVYAGAGSELIIYDQLGSEVRRLRDVMPGQPVAIENLVPGAYHCALVSRGAWHNAGTLIVR